jgi:hypothetical protein
MAFGLSEFYEDDSEGEDENSDEAESYFYCSKLL